MTGEVAKESGERAGFAAYERQTVHRFFAAARQERARLLTDIAAARRRIAQARSELAASADSEYACIHAVLDAQRALREEQRANDRAIAALLADAERQAEQILRDARAGVEPGRDADATADRKTHEPYTPS